MRYYSEPDLKELALASSKTIVIRTYVNGNSSDDERTATEEESTIIFNLIFGALLGCNWGETNRNNRDVQQGIIDSAEFIAHLFIPNANCYDTIYNRIKGILSQMES